MKVWLLSFVVLFGLAELYQWIVGFSWWHQAELPLMIAAGAVLAIASNYNKRAGLPWYEAAPSLKDARPSIASTPAIQVNLSPQPAQPSAQAPAQTPRSPQLPNLEFNLRPRKPISFTIRKPSPPDSDNGQTNN